MDKPLVANIVRRKARICYTAKISIRIFLALISVFFIAGCAGGVRFIKSELGKEVVIEAPLKEFSLGEKLDYTVKWMGIPAGRVTLNVSGLKEIRGHETYHILWTAQTNKFISTFYRVNDKIHTYIDRERFIPWRLEEYRREGRYRRTHIIDYDQLNHKAIHNIKGAIVETPVPPEVQNLLSCLYYIRTKEVEVGDSVRVNVNTRKKIWPLKINVVKGGILEMPSLGRYNAFMIEPEVITKATSNNKLGKIKIWFSADRQRIPLVAETRAPVFGTIQIRLAKIGTVK